MAFVHEGAGDRAGSGVEVFVAAPDGEIDAAVVQLQRKITDAVREVEADHAALRVRPVDEPLQVESLAGAVLHAGPQDQGDAMAVFGQRAFDRCVGDRSVGFVAFDLDQVGGRVETMETDLRFHRVAIGREGPGLDQDGGSFGRRPVEADHQQMQVRRERIHRHHFRRQCADALGQRIAHEGVVGHPGVAPLEVPLDAVLGPVVELFHQRRARGFRLQAERIAAEIQLLASFVLRNQELVAESAQRIGGVASLGVVGGEQVGHVGMREGVE